MPVPPCTAEEASSVFAPIGGGRCNNIKTPTLANKDQSFLRLLPVCIREIFVTRANLISPTGRSSQAFEYDNRLELLEYPQNRNGSGGPINGTKIGVWKPPNPDSIKCNTGNQLPNARLVSRTIHVDQDAPSTVNHLFPMFAQFLCHDLMLTNIQNTLANCCGLTNELCMPITVPPGDTAFAENHCLDFKRAVPYCTPHQNPNQNPTETRYQNLVSAFMDAETIYGNDFQTVKILRAPLGRLMDDPNHLLPVLSIKGEKSRLAGGDTRSSDNPALSTIHTLFMREHNRIADHIAAANRRLNDDQVLFVDIRYFHLIGQNKNKITNHISNGPIWQSYKGSMVITYKSMLISSHYDPRVTIYESIYKAWTKMCPLYLEYLSISTP